MAYRPFVTEDASVAEYHRFELETSGDRLEWANGDSDDGFLMVNSFGAAKRLELAVETPYVFHRAAGAKAVHGFGDVTMASKLQLAPQRDGRPAMLLKGFVKLAHASVPLGLGSGAAHYALAAVASKSLGALVLHGTLGYALVEPRTASRAPGIHFFGGAADYKLSERLRAAVEIQGSRRVERDGLADPLGSYFGVIVPIARSVFLDAGVRRGLSVTAPRWQGALGLFTAF